MNNADDVGTARDPASDRRPPECPRHRPDPVPVTTSTHCIAVCDCFVSLHRSEGFGLAIAEAMAFGKPVIATHWSGNADFMDSITIQPVSITSSSSWSATTGRTGQVSAGPSPISTTRREWMRRLMDDPELGVRLGIAARARVENELSPDAVGGLIRQRLASGDRAGSSVSLRLRVEALIFETRALLERGSLNVAVELRVLVSVRVRISLNDVRLGFSNASRR